LDQEIKLVISLRFAGWIILMKVFWRYKGGEFHEIRASYGTLGMIKLEIMDMSLSLMVKYLCFLITPSNCTATGQIPNPSLKWEQSQKTDIGLI
jgi:hypothetical protein